MQSGSVVQINVAFQHNWCKMVMFEEFDSKIQSSKSAEIKADFMSVSIRGVSVPSRTLKPHLSLNLTVTDVCLRWPFFALLC